MSPGSASARSSRDWKPPDTFNIRRFFAHPRPRTSGCLILNRMYYLPTEVDCLLERLESVVIFFATCRRRGVSVAMLIFWCRVHVNVAVTFTAVFHTASNFAVRSLCRESRVKFFKRCLCALFDTLSLPLEMYLYQCKPCAAFIRPEHRSADAFMLFTDMPTQAPFPRKNGAAWHDIVGRRRALFRRPSSYLSKFQNVTGRAVKMREK